MGEILAVGDIAFRRKCYDALKGLRRKEETLLFVSHDLQAIGEFCDHGLFLLNGQVRARGDIDEVIQEYMFGAWAKPAPSGPEDHATAKNRSDGRNPSTPGLLRDAARFLGMLIQT